MHACAEIAGVFADTFAGYVRAAEDWTDSGLKGVGFLAPAQPSKP